LINWNESRRNSVGVQVKNSKWRPECSSKLMITTRPGVEPAKSHTRRNLTVLLLAVAGGGVDAILISGFQVLTGAQTGNTVLLAVALAQGRFTAGFYSAVSVAAFVIGSVAAELVVLKRKPASALGPMGWALLAELVPLGALCACWHSQANPGLKMTAVLVALAASAMGIQSAAVLRIHGSPTTTYVTGTLSKFSTDFTMWLFDRQAGARSMQRQVQGSPSALLSSDWRILYGLDWPLYLGGGVASALLFSLVKEIALVLPMLAIFVAMVVGSASQPDVVK
jgi:uncharacterized membrane protein YoaK (UPF0700 family)